MLPNTCGHPAEEGMSSIRNLRMLVSVPVRLPSHSLLFRTSADSTSDSEEGLLLPSHNRAPSIFVTYRSKGRIAGPLITFPLRSNAEPWHGQLNTLALVSQWYAHPKCVHSGENT